MNASSDLVPIDWAQRLSTARREASAGGGAVLDVLLRHWSAKPEQLFAALLPGTGVAPLPDGAAWQPDFSRLSIELARELRCVPVEDRAGRRVLSAVDPWDESLAKKLLAIDRSLVLDWPMVAARWVDMRRWLNETAIATTERSPSNDATPTSSASGPIVSLVDSAIARAIATGASDVHFECDRTGVTAKHRLDGVLIHFARMEGVQQAQEVISRIKVLAQLDITERRLPQDGRFHFEANAQRMDLRVSIMPSVHGEDAVLRLLDKAQWRQGAGRADVKLDTLGFDPSSAALIRSLALEPSGMLLVTGPTGSGKTTTLYAVLSEINDGLEKIVTIEDPVEYELKGVLQIPVNERKGLTFARGLRSILRHDPDRILIGEIRDAETAEIAVQASLTGHQVFTTVHANGVADIVGRFRHFGLDMFGFSASLNGVVVQRLLRRLCPHCARSDVASAEELALFGRFEVELPTLLGRAVGCGQCHRSGYSGRFVLAEVHRVDDRLREMMTGSAPLTAIKEHARAMGVESLRREGLRKVAQSLTTLEELHRVVGGL